jgi:hypothetical protein
MAQLQLLEEHAFLQARVALNQYGPRRDQWRAFMNGPSWAFERCMRTQFVPIASRFCVICQMGINGLWWGSSFTLTECIFESNNLDCEHEVLLEICLFGMSKLNFPIGDHLAGSKHARRVQAAIQERGDDYTAFLQVVATAWLPLEGEDFNTVVGTFRPRADANPVEVDDEELAEFRLEVYIPPPHSSGTMVHDGIGLIS